MNYKQIILEATLSNKNYLIQSFCIGPLYNLTEFLDNGLNNHTIDGMVV